MNFNTTKPGRYSLQVVGPKQVETSWFVIENQEQPTMTQLELDNHQSSEVMATIYKTEPAQIKLHLVNNTGQSVGYLIRNEAKEVLYQGNVKEAQYLKAFDMAQATNGKYTLEVNLPTGKVASRTFNVQTANNASFAWTDKNGKPLQPANYSSVPLKSTPVTLEASK